MSGSRTRNSIINSSIGSISQIVSTLLNFIVRTVFIHCLSKEYLGINGLFSNILYVLNFAELGIGNAIVYNMYKPVSENNKERIKQLVNLHKKIYFCIGIVVLLLGVLVIPFMDFIIKDPPNIEENLIIIYILYLLEQVFNYFFGYKRQVLLVYQSNYINSLVDLIFSIIKSIVQIFILIITRNYILYLSIYILSTILSNIAITIVVNKKYSFLKEKNILKVPKKEITELINNVKSLFMYKLGNTVLSGTDNIILSMVVGIVSVGLYSNYSLIITAVSGILWTILTGLTGSIGNFNATSSNKKKEELYKEVLFLSCMLYGFGAVFLGILLKPFIILWIGEDYLLDSITVIFLMTVFYLRGIAFSSNVYRDTLGLFKEGRLAPFICAILNIILSVVLGKILGISGVFLATIISILLTTFWYMPRIIYKNIFKLNFMTYLNSVFKFTIPFAISYILLYFIIDFATKKMNSDFLNLIISLIIVPIITLMIFIAFNFKAKEYIDIKNKLCNFIGRRG